MTEDILCGFSTNICANCCIVFDPSNLKHCGRRRLKVKEFGLLSFVHGIDLGLGLDLGSNLTGQLTGPELEGYLNKSDIFLCKDCVLKIKSLTNCRKKLLKIENAMKSRHDSEQLNLFDIIKANKVLVDKDTENGDTYDAEATPMSPVRHCVHASTESLILQFST